MHPELSLLGWSVDGYGLFFLLGWVVGGVVFYREFRRLGWPLEAMLFVMVGCVLGAVIGSLVVGVLFTSWDDLPQRVRMMQVVGKTVIGGIAGGYVGVEIAKKMVRHPHSTGDAFAVAIPLGHAIGRIGCFLGGCCFGTPSDLPWAVTYPAGSLAARVQQGGGDLAVGAAASHPVHPAPLYELGFDLALFAVLWRLRGSPARRGQLFPIYLASYASYRFIAEYFRGDSPRPEWGLKPIQVLLLLAALWYGVRLWRGLYKRAEAGADAPASASSP